MLPLDEYIEWMFSNGRYDVDIDTGVVTNPRTEKVLATCPNAQGYLIVSLVLSRDVVRTAVVHRMVAVKAFGVECIRGKQIAHLDRVKTHNAASNLWPAPTAKDHVYYDGTHKNLTHRATPKTSWPVCALCGDADGYSTEGFTPDRISGQRFGIDGALCRRCYGTRQERERRSKARLQKLVKNRP